MFSKKIALTLGKVKSADPDGWSNFWDGELSSGTEEEPINMLDLSTLLASFTSTVRDASCLLLFPGGPQEFISLVSLRHIKLKPCSQVELPVEGKSKTNGHIVESPSDEGQPE